MVVEFSFLTPNHVRVGGSSKKFLMHRSSSSFSGSSNEYKYQTPRCELDVKAIILVCIVNTQSYMYYIN